MRAVRETRVIEVQRGPMLTLMSRIPRCPTLSSPYFLRAAEVSSMLGDGSLRLIGEDEDRNVLRIAEFASRNRIPYSSWPLRSPEPRRWRGPANCGWEARRNFWAQHCSDDPTPDKIARLLGLNLDVRDDEKFRCTDRGWRAGRGRCGRVCGGGRSVCARRRGHCYRWSGWCVEPYRELYGLSDRNFLAAI